MLNIDKLLQTLTKEELAEILEGTCINKNTFREDLDAKCEACPFLNVDGKKSCSQRQTEWLLEEYTSPIDWSNSGRIIVIRDNTIMNGDIYMINGSLDGKLYLIDCYDDKGKTIRDLPSYKTVPKSCYIIEDKLCETYKYYDYIPKA